MEVLDLDPLLSSFSKWGSGWGPGPPGLSSTKCRPGGPGPPPGPPILRMRTRRGSRSRTSMETCSYWCATTEKPDWMQNLGWQWAQDGELAKLLGTPFGLHLETCDIDLFLFQKVRKKLIYWSSKFLSLLARAIIVNMVLLSSLRYFISIWAGSKQVIRRIQADVQNYLWAGLPC